MSEGKLYRSGGATGAAADAATPALTDAQRAKLRSTTITDTPNEPTSAPRSPSDSLVAAIVEPIAAPVPPPVREEMVVEELSVEGADSGKRSDNSMGMSVGQVWLVITGFTFIVGLIDGFFHRGGAEASALTWITGLALVVSTIVAAIRVRPSARWYPVLVPPLAFLIVALTAGQFGLSTTGSLIIREGLMVFTTLGRNALWIILAVIIALVIVLLKPRLSRR